MNAAIYARKSTEQFGAADENKSVTRQIHQARAYAAAKGWQVLEDCVFVDDGISGAEFAGRPGFVRLMNTLKPRPPFQVLIMSEESRLGREAIETAYALKQLITGGVRVFFYLEDRERTFDGPTDKLLMSVAAFADELEREKARQRTYDAMQRKARAGHVTGGRVFGYDNHEVLSEPDAQGRQVRQRVERRINESEAAIVRRIFELSAAGTGYTRIAKTLNAERAVCPRPQQDRPSGWAPTTIHEIVRRTIYRGEITWNKSRKRDRWGQHKQSARPESEWLSISAPELRIVSEELWNATQARLARHAPQGAPTVSTRDRDSKYLLSGFARCGVCGGTLSAASRSHGSTQGRRRVFFYSCLAHHKRGAEVCTNSLYGNMEALDRAVLGTLASDVLRPDIVNAVIAGVLDAMRPKGHDEHAAAVSAELATIDREIGRLTEAIATGGQLTALLAALQQRQARRDELRASRALVVPHRSVDRGAVERRVRESLSDWRALLTRNAQDGRELLRRVLDGPIRFTPYNGSYRFEGTAAIGRLLGGAENNHLIWRPRRGPTG
ncbi:MAG: recombinase family protein [Acidobacteriota bacterium]|nr:recombinase family protein [Acidobacteriota bacterium]